jgi:hypothetical protein
LLTSDAPLLDALRLGGFQQIFETLFVFDGAEAGACECVDVP